MKTPNEVPDEMIRKQNDHFKGELIKEPIKPYPIEALNVTHLQIVGCTGNRYKASYLWNNKLNRWGLGAN